MRQRQGRADDLQHEDRARHAVVQRRGADGALVDHLVEALDIEARSCVLRRVVQRTAGECPEPALQLLPRAHGLVLCVAAGNGVREADAVIGVAAQRFERRGPHRFGECLGSQVGGSDRVALVDQRRAPGLVPPYRQREPERQDQPDEPEQCGMHRGERLAQGLGVVAHPPSEEQPETSRADHRREEHEPQLEAGQPEEHAERPSGATT